MDPSCVQVLDFKNVQKGLNNRCWLLVTNGHSTNICLLKPNLNYLIKDNVLQIFAVIRATFFEVKPIAIKKLIHNLYELNMTDITRPLFFIENITVKIPGPKIGHRIISTLKKISIMKLINMSNDRTRILELELPLSVIKDIETVLIECESFP